MIRRPARRRASVRERALASLIGLVLLLILLETGLRITGGFYRGEEGDEEVVSSRKGRGNCLCILCLGDSFTYGVGASKGNDYPRQLEGLLNAGGGERCHIVINGGKGTANTSMILDRLPFFLERVEPDLIILMAGGANELNFWGYNSYIEGRGLSSRVQNLLYRVRIYRLIMFLSKTVKDEFVKRGGGGEEVDTGEEVFDPQWYDSKIAFDNGENPSFDRGMPFLKAGMYEDAREWFQKGISEDPSDSRNYWGMGEVSKALHDYQKAMKWFEIGMEKNPKDPNNYFSAGELHLHRRMADQGAVDLFLKGIEADPSHAGNYYCIGEIYLSKGMVEEALKWFQRGVEADGRDWRNYSGIAMAYRMAGRRGERGLLEGMERFMEGAAFRNPHAGAYRRMMEKEGTRGEEVVDWVADELMEIVTICRGRGIEVILMNYPFDIPVNRAIARVARKGGIPFLDNERLFREIRSTPHRKKEFFVPDGHLNDRGYAMLAQQLSDRIREEGLLPPPAAQGRRISPPR